MSILGVLVNVGCYNKLPQTGSLPNSTRLRRQPVWSLVVLQGEGPQCDPPKTKFKIPELGVVRHICNFSARKGGDRQVSEDC